MKPTVWIVPAAALFLCAMIGVFITPWAWALFLAVLAGCGWVAWRVMKGKGS